MPLDAKNHQSCDECVSKRMRFGFHPSWMVLHEGRLNTRRYFYAHIKLNPVQQKSISSSWSGTWLMLSRRKLLFYDFTESRLEILDLRKARCIGLKESDDSTHNLFIEKGPTMLIDCPPYTCYFVMNSSRETKIWSVVIKDEAHTNGSVLRHQQLTKDNVPVFVDKCINFIYTNGK